MKKSSGAVLKSMHSFQMLPSEYAVNIDSIDDLELVKKQFEEPWWVFRGQSKSSWQLKTALNRTHIKSINPWKERDAIVDFRNKCHGLKLDCGKLWIDTLACMQHYGVPTRLLDFTWNFNVALWFAMKDECDTNYRALWVLNLRRAIEKSLPLIDSIEDSASKIAIDCELDGEEFVQLKEYFRDESFYSPDDFAARASKVAECCLRAAHVYTGGVLPVVCSESSFNMRMKAQKGLFMLPLNYTSFARNLAKTLCKKNKFVIGQRCSVAMCDAILRSASAINLVKVRINNSLRADILSELKKVNIDTVQMFPDYSGVAQSIRYI